MFRTNQLVFPCSVVQIATYKHYYESTKYAPRLLLHCILGMLNETKKETRCVNYLIVTLNKKACLLGEGIHCSVIFTLKRYCILELNRYLWCFDFEDLCSNFSEKGVGLL